MTGNKLTVRNLNKNYDGVPILERINIDIKSGEFCAIVGASGCGKSTFLRMLLSQERPSGGTILLDDIPIPDEPTPDRGIVFQKYSVFSHLTVAENLILATEFEKARFTSRLFGNARQTALVEIEDILDRIGLTTSKNKFPAQLSGGMQQRLAIAQALIKRPSILLLDEPFGALDPGIRADMHELLLSLWQELDMTIFMVTHDIHEAFKLGTRLLVFDKVRHDPHAPEAYGATITYDLALSRPTDAEETEEASPEAIETSLRASLAAASSPVAPMNPTRNKNEHP